MPVICALLECCCNRDSC